MPSVMPPLRKQVRPKPTRFKLTCVLVVLAVPSWAFAEEAPARNSSPTPQHAKLNIQNSSLSVQTRTGTITIPTYLWGPDDVNPHFPQIVGKPIYPYPMQDNLSRKKVDKTYDTLVLENKYLRVTVVPELGGHVHSVFDKSANREMFYVNQVIKPGLIGMRGAWISGGIEFNTGPQGHTVTAVSPVSCRFVDFDDGSKAIAVGNIERVFRTQWVAVIRLRPGRSFLEERIRIYNPTPYVQPYYFWNCTAVPNTDGTQFIYPMTLGTDHGGTNFFRWPIDKGVDLSWSKNYRSPTSIFAYQCDQDFFGSYDHQADHGIVAYANHFDLPGKKAWTWGRGGEGIAAQATLTDDGTLYNEVQTGPLVTQADYGLLQPHQTVEWTEWWYPVHGIDGYEFATRDVAVNVTTNTANGKLAIKLIGTGTWENAVCRIKSDPLVASREISISPRRPTIIQIGNVRKRLWDLSTPGFQPEPPLEYLEFHSQSLFKSQGLVIEIIAGDRVLASFTHPLPLPKREPPDKLLAGLSALGKLVKTARDHWADGVLADKQSKPDEARKHFDQALELDPNFAPAHLALAVLDLEAGLPQDAKPHLEKILERDNDNGLAHYYLARALLEMENESEALEHAWRSARDPASASIGLGVAGEIYIRQRRWNEAITTLQRAVAKDEQDILNRNLLTLALAKVDRRAEALAQARLASECDPLDPLAELGILGLSGKSDAEVKGSELFQRLRLEPQTVLEVAALYYRLKQYHTSEGLPREVSLAKEGQATPISCYYVAVSADLLGRPPRDAAEWLDRAAQLSPDQVFPDRLETIAILQHAARLRPDDWRIYHYLGCLYLAHYRKADAVAAWQKALSLGSNSSVVHRNLGIVRWKLDNDTTAAISHYEKAVGLRPDDLTLYRDLATLYRDSDRWTKVRDLLEKTLGFERYRSDVIELLARAYHRLGEDEKAAALIDSRTFLAWEGQRSLHQIYRDVHVALGKQAMEAKEYKKAVAEFRRSLDYPPNLGVGRPEYANETEQKDLLAKALAAAGQKD